MTTPNRSNTLTQDASHARLLHQTVDNTKADGLRDVSGEAQEVSLLDHSTTSTTRRRTLLNLGAMAAATALVATLALPGTGIAPAANAESNASAEAIAQLQATQSQQLDQPALSAVAAVDASRAEFTATSPAELRRIQQAAAAAAAAAAWSGPRVNDFLANPPYPNFSLAQVAQVALQYQGVPYKFGGSTPAGFDCSGFVMYVYAQFGISLPHGVRGQASLGTPISRADAQPGDVIIFNDMSHSGFYMGGGQILDAPVPGQSIRVRPLWTDAYYIVRFGI